MNLGSEGLLLARLEGDVVVVAAAADPGALEVRGVSRDVGRSGEAVPAAAAAAVAGTEDPDRVGDHLDGLALAAVGLPLAPLEAPVDRDRSALAEVVGAVLALRAPDRDVEIVGLVDDSPLESLRRLLTASRRLQTEVPLGVLRSSGSRVRFPVRMTLLMFVAATSLAPLCRLMDRSLEGERRDLARRGRRRRSAETPA